MTSLRPNQGPPWYPPQNRHVPGPIMYDSNRPQMMNSNPLGHVPVHPSQAMQPMMFGSVPPVGFGPGNYHPAPNVPYDGTYPGMPYGNPQNYYQPNSRVSSGSSSTINSSQSSPYSIPSSGSSLYSQQGYVSDPTAIYETQPLPSHDEPTRNENPSVKSIILAHPQKEADIVEMHPLLRPDSCHSTRRIQWNVNNDPSSALCKETKIPDETLHEPAFMPSRHTIMIVIGFDASETRGFAMMEPDNKMRSFWFPMSAYMIRNGGKVRVEDVQVQPRSQKILDANAASAPQRELTLRTVLSNIYNILRIPLKKEVWSQLNIREKLAAAKRMSIRRSALDKISCVDSLQEAAKLEMYSFTREKQGIRVDETWIAKVKEAHEQLDSYAFHRDPDFKSWSLRGPPIIGDFVGARTTFKGLQQVQKNPGDLDTFFLCVA